MGLHPELEQMSVDASSAKLPSVDPKMEQDLKKMATGNEKDMLKLLEQA